ncbi:hypothetical protein HQ563_11135 [bacterium]|nr:hypothetical protein [bacterium]
MRTTIFLLLAVGLMNAAAATTSELSGYVAAEGSVFFNSPLSPEQERHSASLALQPEFYHEWENGSGFLVVPFARLDSADPERTHFDVRELNYLWLADRWELRVGVGKVFWGTTEFVHLVDIVNQTDLVEDIDEEDKLGQPMVHLSIPRDWGIVDMFILPYFRERTFPGRKGRLRFPLVVDTDNAKYESAAEEHRLDFAIRYSHSIGDWDIGIYHFNGTGREPTLLPDSDENGEPVLIPLYEQINQTGVDLQLVAGQWLWKLEALYRTGQADDFFAAVGGFEYTLVGVAGTAMDLGIVAEWAYDDRGDEATTPYENDAMFGFRLTLNDPASSQILAGLMQDMHSSARAISIEASHRIGSNWKATLEAWAFLDAPEDDLFYSFRDDDFVRLGLAYYF